MYVCSYIFLVFKEKAESNLGQQQCLRTNVVTDFTGKEQEILRGATTQFLL